MTRWLQKTFIEEMTPYFIADNLPSDRKRPYRHNGRYINSKKREAPDHSDFSGIWGERNPPPFISEALCRLKNGFYYQRARDIVLHSRRTVNRNYISPRSL